jgi:hypothetical protein
LRGLLVGRVLAALVLALAAVFWSDVASYADTDVTVSFDTTGGTYTVPCTCSVQIVAVGSGGGGEGGTTAGAGGGGGRGGDKAVATVSATEGDVYAVQIGAGGAGGAANNSADASSGALTKVTKTGTDVVVAAGGAGASGRLGATAKVGTSTGTITNGVAGTDSPAGSGTQPGDGGASGTGAAGGAGNNAGAGANGNVPGAGGGGGKGGSGTAKGGDGATGRVTFTATLETAPVLEPSGDSSGVWVYPPTGEVRVTESVFVGIGVAAWIAAVVAGLATSWLVLP